MPDIENEINAITGPLVELYNSRSLGTLRSHLKYYTWWIGGDYNWGAIPYNEGMSLDQKKDWVQQARRMILSYDNAFTKAVISGYERNPFKDTELGSDDAVSMWKDLFDAAKVEIDSNNIRDIQYATLNFAETRAFGHKERRWKQQEEEYQRQIDEINRRRQVDLENETYVRQRRILREQAGTRTSGARGGLNTSPQANNQAITHL